MHGPAGGLNKPGFRRVLSPKFSNLPNSESCSLAEGCLPRFFFAKRVAFY